MVKLAHRGKNNTSDSEKEECDSSDNESSNKNKKVFQNANDKKCHTIF